jgi:ribonucleoside-diphosphate reductase alpha chain
MACVERAVHAASEALAKERGACPAFRGTGPERRNASLLAIAPTGTLRLLAGCNGGIEPWLDPVVRVETTGGASHRWIDRWLLDWLAAHDDMTTGVVDALAEGAPSTSLGALPERERVLLRRAYETSPHAQLALQARFQAHVDGGVSKTIHLPADASTDEIAELIHLARRLGCKGVAFWRSAGLEPIRCIRCGAG